MKALSIEGIGQTRLREVDGREVGPDEVLVDVAYVGLCGSDFNTYRGLNPLVDFPRIPGHEASGVIAAKGSNVGDGLQIGQSVILWPYSACGHCSSCLQGRPNACKHNETLGVQRDGALREKMVIRADCVLPNDSLSPKLQALVEPLAVGFHAVARGQATDTDVVVVLGCGMIGLGAILSAASRGARVIAVDMIAEKEQIARALGAEAFLTSRGDGLLEQVQELSDGEGASLVVEAVGLPETFTAAVDLAAFCGRVVYVGYSKAPVTYETKFFNLKELDILGSRNATRDDFADVIASLEVMGNKAEQLISRTVSMDEADGVLPYWENNKDDVLKLVVEL